MKFYKGQFKGKTYEEIYGVEKANELKKIRSLARLGKRHNERTKRICSETNKGNTYWLGKHHKLESNIKNSKKHKLYFEKSQNRLKTSIATKNAMTEEVIKKIKEKRAKQVFPLKDTTIEVKIQNFLKALGIEFFTHQYIKEIEHGYQCDIFIPSMNLVIECDGEYWHNYPTRTEIDNIRTKELLEKGFKVLRLWEREIRALNLDEFKEKL